MDSETSGLVTIDGIEYSLVDIPGSETEVVKRKCAEIRELVSVEAFEKDFQHVGICIQQAYYGVTAARESKLQAKVKKLSIDLTILCDASSTTMQHFQVSSAQCLQNYQTAITYLLDGFDDISLQCLGSASETAMDMVTLTKQKQKNFENEVERVKGVIDEMYDAQGDHDHCAKEKSESVMEFKHMMAKQEKLTSDIQEKLHSDLEKLCKNELREDEAVESLKGYEGFMKYIFRIGIGFLCARGGISQVDFSSESEQQYFEAVHKIKNEILTQSLQREEKLSKTIEHHSSSLFNVENA